MPRLIVVVLVLTAAIAFGATYAMSQQDDVSAREVVAALEGAYGVHKGERRNHTKGACALGHFIGNPARGRTLDPPCSAARPCAISSRRRLLCAVIHQEIAGQVGGARLAGTEITHRAPPSLGRRRSPTSSADGSASETSRDAL